MTVKICDYYYRKFKYADYFINEQGKKNFKIVDIKLKVLTLSFIPFLLILLFLILKTTLNNHKISNVYPVIMIIAVFVYITLAIFLSGKWTDIILENLPKGNKYNTPLEFKNEKTLVYIKDNFLKGAIDELIADCKSQIDYTTGILNRKLPFALVSGIAISMIVFFYSLTGKVNENEHTLLSNLNNSKEIYLFIALAVLLAITAFIIYEKFYSAYKYVSGISREESKISRYNNILTLLRRFN